MPFQPRASKLRGPLVLGEWGSEIIGVKLKGPTPTMQWNVVLQDLTPSLLEEVIGLSPIVLMQDLTRIFRRPGSRGRLFHFVDRLQ